MNIKTGISILEIPVFCLQKMGVEPTRYYYHTDLNRARLPIPPLLHFFFIALALSLSDM